MLGLRLLLCNNIYHCAHLKSAQYLVFTWYLYSIVSSHLHLLVVQTTDMDGEIEQLVEMVRLSECLPHYRNPH